MARRCGQLKLLNYNSYEPTTRTEKEGSRLLQNGRSNEHIVQEELANDIFELSTRHKEEIAKLMEEYDN